MQTQYATIATGYIAIKDRDPFDEHIIFPCFYEAVGDVRGKTVLELACGEGRAGRELFKRGAKKLVGVDEEPNMLKVARERAPRGAEYYRATVGRLGHIHPFDVVLGPWLLHYSETNDMLVRMFRDVALNLRYDGLFVGLNEDPEHPLGGTERVGYTVSANAPFDEGSPMRVTLFGAGTSESFTIYHWRKGTYVAAARAAGLDIEFIPFTVPQRARDALGAELVAEFMATRCSCIFRCRHQ